MNIYKSKISAPQNFFKAIFLANPTFDLSVTASFYFSKKNFNLDQIFMKIMNEFSFNFLQRFLLKCQNESSKCSSLKPQSMSKNHFPTHNQNFMIFPKIAIVVFLNEIKWVQKSKRQYDKNEESTISFINNIPLVKAKREIKE